VDAQRFGRIVKALRARRAWTQARLGAACGMSASKVSRIERGFLAGVPVDDLGRVIHALDARLELDVRWRGALVDRLLDERHAALVDPTVRWLTSEGWTTIVEASFSIRGERGSIDVFGLHPSRALLVVEVKASIGDANQTLIGLDRKGRLAPIIARERGWPAGPVSRILVVGESTTSRARIRRHEAAFRAALPAGTSTCRAWVRAPKGVPIAGIVFMRAAAAATIRRGQ
jgi:transcriptional regulator with XRE-family HTH domain